MRFHSVCRKRGNLMFSGIQVIISFKTESIKLKLTKLGDSAKLYKNSVVLHFFLAIHI